jgi:hypothetical protein
LSGGATDEALSALLAELSLTHLDGPLSSSTLGSLQALPRPELLAKLKECGVSKLPERQK